MISRIAWTLIFAVAFAYVESAVVVYLREIYTPEGFDFPITIIPDRLMLIEVGREASTLLMLAAAGLLAGRDAWERFLFFAAAFGTWDIFYYVWLRVFLGWPESLLSWDILFLIPVPWIAPVLAPVLISIALVAGSAWLLMLKGRGVTIRFSRGLWAAAVAGGLIVLASFMIDHRVILDGGMPPPFRWWLFGAGLGVAVGALIQGVLPLHRQLRSPL